jgi:hypothetical protein
VFDTANSGDALTLHGKKYSRANCPTGVALAAGDTLSWTSNDRWQGQRAAGGSLNDAGGGWQICFKDTGPSPKAATEGCYEDQECEGAEICHRNIDPEVPGDCGPDKCNPTTANFDKVIGACSHVRESHIFMPPCSFVWIITNDIYREP